MRDICLCLTLAGYYVTKNKVYNNTLKNPSKSHCHPSDISDVLLHVACAFQ